jgi:uncharacterized membrane protein
MAKVERNGKRWKETEIIFFYFLIIFGLSMIMNQTQRACPLRKTTVTGKSFSEKRAKVGELQSTSINGKFIFSDFIFMNSLPSSCEN